MGDAPPQPPPRAPGAGLVHPTAKLREGRIGRWRELSEGSGLAYSALGDWSQTWDVYAERAVAGKWQQSGEETFARRRAGLTPETPVREVEGKKD